MGELGDQVGGRAQGRGAGKSRGRQGLDGGGGAELLLPLRRWFLHHIVKFSAQCSKACVTAGKVLGIHPVCGRLVILRYPVLALVVSQCYSFFFCFRTSNVSNLFWASLLLILSCPSPVAAESL